MNKIFKSAIIVLLAICAMSCDSYFDVELQDQATLEEMFSKRGTARQLAAHMYAYLPKEENPVDATTEGARDRSLMGAARPCRMGP